MKILRSFEVSAIVDGKFLTGDQLKEHRKKHFRGKTSRKSLKLDSLDEERYNDNLELGGGIEE